MGPETEDLKEIMALVKEYHPASDTKLIEEAYSFAQGVHTGDMTGTGRPFILHPLCTARIVAGIGGDEKAVAATILHNTWDAGAHNVNDMRLATKDGVMKRFGKEIVSLIEDVLNETTIEMRYKDKLPPLLVAKLLVASVNDKRGFLIKLAAKVDNLREAEKWEGQKKREIADEALNIYAPLAQKLGIYQIKDEIEELGFKYLQPEEYAELSSKIKAKTSEQEKYLYEAEGILKKKLSDAGIEAEMMHRKKTVYSSYKKMERRACGFDEIYDLLGLRVITNSVKDCYVVLGLVHSQWEHIKSEFNDYIAKPKQNNYRSIHTTVTGPGNALLEIQIRTNEMHKIAELGVAADWKYMAFSGKKYDKKLMWMREILEWEKKSGGADIDGFEMDYRDGLVIAMTPKGEAVELPKGSTALDFAYAIHCDLGNHCSRIMVNGKLVPLKHILKNLDVAEVITSPKQRPHPNWLNIVKTEKAAKRIRQALHIKITKPKKGDREAGDGLSVNVHRQRIKLAKCCGPVFGDKIVGYRTSKRKISVHRYGCEEAKNLSLAKAPLRITWGANAEENYFTWVNITAEENVCLLTDLLRLFSKFNVPVSSASLRSVANNTANYAFRIRVKNMEELNSIISSLEKISGIKKVARM